MNLPVHVLTKDLRRWWPLAAATAVFLLLETLAPLWGVGLYSAHFEPGELLVAFGKWPLIFILVVVVMQEDRTVGDQAFWRTRPIASGALLAGKLLFFGLALALPAVFANLGVATALATPGAVTLGIAVETIGFTVLAVLFAALLAAMTGTLLHAGLAALGAVFVVILLGVARNALGPVTWIRLPWDTDVPYPGPRVAVACGLACVALIALLGHQIVTRRTGRTIGWLAFALPAVLAVSVTWNVEFTPHSRLTLFPDQPLAPSEAFTVTLEQPARLAGTDWVWDAAARRNRPERAVAAYAELERPIPGRFFVIAEGQTHLALADGRELTFPYVRQNDYSWNNVQREGAVCRALGLPYARPDTASTQGQVRLFSMPERQLAALGGATGRLSLKLTFGETAFRETFSLPPRSGATRREPGLVWRIDRVKPVDESPAEITLQFLRATTMLAPYSNSRADVNPDPTSDRLFILVNRKRSDYSTGWVDSRAEHPGIIASRRVVISFNNLRRAGRKQSDTPIDAAWLADAEFVVLRTEPLGRTEKTIVVEGFEVPRLP